MRPFLTIFYLSSLLSSRLLALPNQETKLITRSLEVLEADDGGISVNVELQCGEHLKGILIQEELTSPDSQKKARQNKKNSQILRLIGVVDSPDLRCSLLPKTLSLSLPMINSDHFDQIESIRPDDEGERVLLAEVDIVSISPLLTMRLSQVKSFCRPYLGAMFAVNLSGNLDLAAAFGAKMHKTNSAKEEVNANALNAANCSVQQKMTVSSLRSSDIKPLRSIKNLSELYAFRVHAPERLSKNENGAIQLAWNRPCREMSLGVVALSSDLKELGVVSIFAPNAVANCTGSKLETITLDAFKLSDSPSTYRMLTPLAALAINQQSYNLSVRGVEDIETSAASHEVRLKSPVQACNKTLGYVLGQDVSGNAFVGLMMQDGNQCEKEQQERSTAKVAHQVPGDKPLAANKFVKLPVVVNADQNGVPPTIFPLRVRGSKVY